MENQTQAILVADIGGTNARFALARPGTTARPELAGIEQLATADYASLKDAAEAYLQQQKSGTRPQRAVFAVASAVTGDAIKITNNPWSFSIARLGADLGLQLEIINDFTAMACVLPVLVPGDLQAIGDVAPRAAAGGRRCYAVVGPGTGLGVGGVIVEGGRSVVIQSEGGHVGFAPGTPYEIELLRVLLPRFGRVSAERLVSGIGMVNLHDAVRAVEGLTAQTLTPAQIGDNAAADPGGAGAKTLQVFAELLGAFAGDVALAFGAWDGVFLPGGVTQKLLPWIAAGGFRRRFEDKGRHAAILRAIPTQVITHPQAGLLGAAVQACA
ncbi:MAG: Glucokinase [Hydrocarboniphaga sp.]|uniref:glucokinase n=1 Tax=Hydrocarboniphaga sp. TaxID=2033016 RepID=UPI00262675EB|nr:glucokinase [Hydrocarboniphaga sp.]MDB5970300.1 Glucokinase [Hydrocarboniphaga sp.]